MCPKAALLWRVLHLRSHRAPPSTPLARIMTLLGGWENITPTMISNILKTAVGFCGINMVLEAKDVYAHSLRNAGDMVLF